PALESRCGTRSRPELGYRLARLDRVRKIHGAGSPRGQADEVRLGLSSAGRLRVPKLGGQENIPSPLRPSEAPISGTRPLAPRPAIFAPPASPRAPGVVGDRSTPPPIRSPAAAAGPRQCPTRRHACRVVTLGEAEGRVAIPRRGPDRPRDRRPPNHHQPSP